MSQPPVVGGRQCECTRAAVVDLQTSARGVVGTQLAAELTVSRAVERKHPRSPQRTCNGGFSRNVELAAGGAKVVAASAPFQQDPPRHGVVVTVVPDGGIVGLIGLATIDVNPLVGRNASRQLEAAPTVAIAEEAGLIVGVVGVGAEGLVVHDPHGAEGTEIVPRGAADHHLTVKGGGTREDEGSLPPLVNVGVSGEGLESSADCHVGR